MDTGFRRLSSGRVLITGATGFVGQALLARILDQHPRVRVVLVVRHRGGQDARARLARLVAKPAFVPWRARVGNDEAERAVASRVTLIEADLGQSVPHLPTDIRAVIHCAGEVAFDRPLDDIVRTNVLGTLNLLQGVRLTGASPHFVHVSTAYVTGCRDGTMAEAAVKSDADWRAELDCAAAARQAAELESRSADLQARFLRQARRDDGQAGAGAVASRAERLRTQWLARRLTDYGRTRARVLGWPDTYSFSKALAEQALEQAVSTARAAGEAPALSIVRPSIIETALAAPFPGWSDSFKTSGPLIVAYGQGLVTAVPMQRETVLDIVPVDLVVNALLAVAANPPAAGRTAYYHVASSARNPLTGGQLLDHMRGYFQRHPLPDAHGEGTVAVPECRFIPPQLGGPALRGAQWLAGATRQGLLRLPAAGQATGWLDTVVRQEGRVSAVRRLAELYAHYLELDVVFTDDRTLALHRSMPGPQRREAGFDVAALDWTDYLNGTHFPSVVAPLRALADVPARRVRGGAVRPPSGDGVVAVFDLEGTVLASNVVEAYLWTRLLDRDAAECAADLAGMLSAVPRYLSFARRGRGAFLRDFAHRYRGACEEDLRLLVLRQVGDLVLTRAWPAALRQIRQHREAGHRTVLVTGTLDLFVAPLRPLFDDVVAARLEFAGSRATGALLDPPVVGDARAEWLRLWCERHDADPRRVCAYADHYSDRAFLEAAGHPVAVNPDARLRQYARQAHWPIVMWADHALGPVAALTGALRAQARRR